VNEAIHGIQAADMKRDAEFIEEFADAGA